MNLVRTCSALLVIFLAPATAALAATYYVDYAGGADGNQGESATAAFKHSPGDPEAKEKAAAVKLQPGDAVLFKGGVVYHGGMVVQQSGAEGRPITFDGNSAGKFGTGRAIVDGSEPLTGWRQCAAAEECDGNPNWQNIWRTEVPYAIGDPSEANLYEDQDSLQVAQDPRPKTPFPPEPATEYFTFDVNKATTTTLQDEKYFVQTQAHAWDGALVTVYLPGGLYFRKVTGFDPAAHRITFQEFADINGATIKRYTKYAVLNALVILKHPGQYVVRSDGQKATIYLWPLKSGAAPAGVTISRRRNGFNLNGQSYVTVEGFLLQKFVSVDGHGSAIEDKENKTNGGLVIRNNVITACSRGFLSTLSSVVIYLTGQKGSLVEKNEIDDNPGSGGIAINLGAGHVVKDNVIRHYRAAAILMGKNSAQDCQIIGNTITDSVGAKSFGILIFGKCANILVTGNRVINGGHALMLSGASDITIAGNVFYNNREYSHLMQDEGTGGKNVRLFHNTAINAAPERASIWIGGSLAEAIKKNNIFVATGAILDGGASFKLDETHNLWTDPAHLKDIFVDPEHQDYRLKKGSPAIGAGVVTAIKQDTAGQPFPQDKAPDVGAFVYRDK